MNLITTQSCLKYAILCCSQRLGLFAALLLILTLWLHVPVRLSMILRIMSADSTVRLNRVY